MAKTQLADLVLPENFANYVSEESTNRAASFRSGIVAPVPGLAITKGAKLTVPFLKPLSGSAQILADNASLTAAKVTSGAHVALVNSRGGAFSANDLSAALAAADPVRHIVESVGQWWAEQLDAQVLAVLKGATASAASKVHDISGGTGADAVFSAEDFIDAQHKMGDARSKLAAVMQHSAVTAKMEKLDLIQYVTDSTGAPVKTYRGLPIIENDNMVAESGVYTSYLIARGAVAFAEGLDLAEAEMARDALAGDTTIVTRRSYVLHPQGFATTLDIGANGESPANTVLDDAASWNMVADAKNVGVVAFKFKLA